MSEGIAMVDWNEDNQRQLQCLHGQGLSFTEIAAEMGVSRNAAIGKAHRMQLPSREFDAPAARGHNGARPLQPKEVRHNRIATVTMLPTPPTPPIPDADYSCEIYALDNVTCRWPLWQFNTPHEARRYCGHPSADFYSGRPYCERHTRLCSGERH